MFDANPEPEIKGFSIPLANAARQFVSTSGKYLVLLASRAGGEDGAALAYVFWDMVLDGSVRPIHWPLPELIALLRTPGTDFDEQADHMIRRLERLRARIVGLRRHTDE